VWMPIDPTGLVTETDEADNLVPHVVALRRR
jgi:hypothetical protein